MDEFKISLSPEVEQNTDEAIQCLIEAATQVFTSSEQDFEEMKNTKWYQRLWKIITFSKDNEKKLANGVSSLAKLQEIVMKALLLLSEKSAEVSDFVCQHDEDIARLTKNQVALAKTQNAILDELDRLKSGAEKTITLYDIEGEKRKIFMTAFCSVVDSLDSSESFCQEYYRQVCHALEFSDAQTGIRLSSVDMFTRRETLLLYRVIMEYVFLATDSFDCEVEILKYLAVSPKAAETTKAFISKQVLRGGKEIFLTNYCDNEYTFVEDDEIEWDFDDEEGQEEQDEPIFNEPSEIILNDIIHIGADEYCTYTKKKIDIRAFIECKGTLVFDNCEIVIDDDESPKGSIELIENGAIVFNNCRIFMYYKSANFWISAAKNTSIRLQKCFLNGCGMFIETDGNCEVDSCQFIHPGVNLLSCKSWNDSKGVVKNSYFYQRYYPSHIEYNGSETYASILEGISVIDNCRVERDKDCFLYSKYGSKMAFLDSKKVDICHMTFKDWNKCIRSYGVSEIRVRLSAFERCENAILVNQLNVENCNFYECLNPIETLGKSEVSHCQFYKCCGNAITSTSKTDIKYCLFDTCKALPYSNAQNLREHMMVIKTLCSMEEVEIKDFCENAIIHISISKHEKTHSQIVKCRFCNIDLGNSYLIKGNDYVEHKNVILKINDCEFSNCKSLRKDQKLVRMASLREHNSVSPLVMITPLLAVKKTIKEFTNINLVNCAGIYSESGVIANDRGVTVNEFVPREYTASKEKIGCSLEED